MKLTSHKKSISFKHQNYRNFFINHDFAILLAGTLLFIISYRFDENVHSFFSVMPHFATVDAILSIATNFGVIVFVMLFIPSIALFRKTKRNAYFLWLAFIASIVLALIIKLVVLRQRPVEAFAYPFIGILSYSFPSMHSMVAFSLMVLLTGYLPKQKHFWVCFAFLVAFSRIYFGFHFLSDVVFGAFMGYFVGKYMLGIDKGHGKNNKV